MLVRGQGTAVGEGALARSGQRLPAWKARGGSRSQSGAGQGFDHKSVVNFPQ